MRVVKEAEERRNEILDAAEILFTNKGYAKTTIIDILEAVGIAKGTFYYHFKSKEEVMDAIIDRIVEGDVRVAKAIADDPGLSPVQKIFAIIQGQQPESGDHKEQLIEQFHSPANAEMHQKSVSRAVLALAPILADVVEQGIEDHVFQTDYPRETMEFLILCGQNLFDTSMFQWTPEELGQRVLAFVSMMECLLGADKGSFACMSGLLADSSAERTEHAE